MSKDNDKVIDDTLKQAGTLGQMLGQTKRYIVKKQQNENKKQGSKLII